MRQGDAKGFTLVELALSAFLLSILLVTAWGLLGHYVFFSGQAADKTDLYNSLRFSLNRMSREIKYARSISAASDLPVINFVNSSGDAVSYYCQNYQLIRREKGVSTPLSGNIKSISFSYITKDGLVINQTNITAEKLSPGWTSGLSMINIEIVAGKPGAFFDPIPLTRKINLRSLP